MSATTPSPKSPPFALLAYWFGLYLCLLRGKSYQDLRAAQPGLAPGERLQIYWLCLHLRLWNSPHYRSGTWSADLVKNLRNVALPGTGVPLSLLCHSKLIATAFVWFGVPLAALAAAVIARHHRGEAFGPAFASALLQPRDWFSYWRLNCVIASYHALKTSDGGYALEDKLTFLQACAREGVAVSPWLKTPKLVVKHRNEEGGLGMHTFTNADAGGDWIVQAWLRNAPEVRAAAVLERAPRAGTARVHPSRVWHVHRMRAQVARLLPHDAPLSTLRLVTASRACVRRRPVEEVVASDVLVLSGCFRAGRQVRVWHARTCTPCM